MGAWVCASLTSSSAWGVTSPVPNNAPASDTRDTRSDTLRDENTRHRADRVSGGYLQRIHTYTHNTRTC